MKIYLAAPFETREAMREWRRKLEDEGFAVTSRWIDVPPEISPLGFNPQTSIKTDLDDIDASDAIVLFHTPGQHGPQCRGSRHVEWGYALKAGKLLVLVGQRENLFHFHPRVVAVDAEHLVEVMRGIRSLHYKTDYPTQL